jgi:ferrous iron transport protein A
VVARAIVNKNLTELPLQTEGSIVQFSNELIGSKLMAMGVLPGSKVAVIRKSPFGGSWYVKADGTCLALRKAEVASIIVEYTDVDEVWEPKSSSSTAYPPAVPAWPAGTDRSGSGKARTTSRQV